MKQRVICLNRLGLYFSLMILMISSSPQSILADSSINQDEIAGSTESLPIVDEAYSITETLLHTVVQIQVYHQGVEEIVEGAIRYIKDMENLLSTNLPGSDVYRINQNAGIKPIHVSPETFEIVTKAKEIAEESQGLFDVSIGVVTNLWRIGSDEARRPNDSEIKAALPKIDYRKIILNAEDQTIFLEDRGMAIELGGISKGYIGSGVARYFQDNGITTAIINLGGNVVVLGTSPSNAAGWNVGIQDPDQDQGQVVGAQRVINSAVVTSGIYERFLKVDEHIYHHIIDPKTGYPLDNEVSAVTVFAPTSFEGDAYSTALFLLGIEEGIKLMNAKEGFEVVYIDRNKGIHLSEGLKDTFELLNEMYHVVD